MYDSLIDTDLQYLQSQFPMAQFEVSGHHTSHAASGFFASKYDDAIIFSVDGGGVDHGITAYTKIFKGNVPNGKTTAPGRGKIGMSEGKLFSL